MIAQGECITASVTAIYNCQGNAANDFTAVWSTGQTDEASFSCG